MAYPSDNLADVLTTLGTDAGTASSSLGTIGAGTDVLVSNFAGLQSLVNDLSSLASVLKNETFYVPVGGIIPFGGLSGNVPSGWLVCDGSAVSTTTYADLYTVLGANAYGTDSGGTFFLPDLRGRVPFGLNSANSSVDSRSDNDGLSAANRRPQHSHTVTDPGHAHTTYFRYIDQYGTSNYSPAGNAGQYGFATVASSTVTTGVSVGPAAPTTGGTPADTVPYIVTNYIIKV